MGKGTRQGDSESSSPEQIILNSGLWQEDPGTRNYTLTLSNTEASSVGSIIGRHVGGGAFKARPLGDESMMISVRPNVLKAVRKALGDDKQK